MAFSFSIKCKRNVLTDEWTDRNTCRNIWLLLYQNIYSSNSIPTHILPSLNPKPSTLSPILQPFCRSVLLSYSPWSNPSSRGAGPSGCRQPRGRWGSPSPSPRTGWHLPSCAPWLAVVLPSLLPLWLAPGGKWGRRGLLVHWVFVKWES